MWLIFTNMTVLCYDKNSMNQDKHLEEVRWHGRGGQGAVLGASMLGSAAALYEGKYAVSFPSFGAERRGAPVQAFTRISDSVIRTRSQIYHPTRIIVLDDTLLGVVNITDGARSGATVLVNSRKQPSELNIPDSLSPVTIDATSIAREIIGVAIVNTAMLGALAGVTGLVSIDSVKKAIADVLPEKVAERNIAAAEAAFEKVMG
jgi:pyruvate ferredoxin oxidoreductase gamma subunit